MKDIDLLLKLKELRGKIEPIIEEFEAEIKINIRSVTYDKEDCQSIEIDNKGIQLKV